MFVLIQPLNLSTPMVMCHRYVPLISRHDHSVSIGRPSSARDEGPGSPVVFVEIGTTGLAVGAGVALSCGKTLSVN
jgi:hypothetical protein